MTSDTYYWKVIASDGTNNETSTIWQFDLDLCQPDPTYSYANTYPMSYNLSTDTITVWGSNGTTYDAMGSNSSDPITFENIFEFGKAVRGACGVSKPAAGSYAILSRLELGNTTSNVNTTFVRTTGESIDFGKQLQLNYNSTLTSGQLTVEGSPYGGSTLSFSGIDSTDNNEGEFFLQNGSYFKLYDTGVSHKTTANDSNPFRLYWNGDVTAKSSTLQNWHTIRFLGSANTLTDIILTDMGEGFYPATTQTGTINTVKSRKIDTGGLVLSYGNNVTITGLEISEATNDILVLNYSGTANLINAIMNFSNINWTSGTYSGGINRKYEYSPTVTDSTGALLENTTLVLIDVRGDILFSLTTDSNGQIASQTITRAIYDYAHQSGDERGPHRLLVKKFGKSFQENSKSFSAATIETLQVSDNGFSSLSTAEVEALTNITYNEPTKVSYGQEYNSTWSTTGQLLNYPIDTCQYYALFANGSKLTEGSSNDYTINAKTGAIIFNTDMTGYNISAAYYYGGNLSLTNGITVSNAFSMAELYDFMQYSTATNNLSEDLTTVDGITYSFCINLAVGDESDGGSIVDAGKTIGFNDGYDVVQGSAGSLIDLAGVGGSGLIGAIELSKQTVNPGHYQTVFVSLADNLGNPLVGRTLYSKIHYPNGTVWIPSTEFTEIGDAGLYKYEFQMTNSNSIPYGAYAVHITSTGISEVRTFSFEPEHEIIVQSHLDTVEYLDMAYAEMVGPSSVLVYGAIENELPYAQNISQYHLWADNHLVSFGNEFKETWDSMKLYEETSDRLLEDFESNSTSNWTSEGNVDLAITTGTVYSGTYALNVTVNTTAPRTNFSISRNFTTPVDMSYNLNNQTHVLDSFIYLPDLNLDNITVRAKTNNTSYYEYTKTLNGWKIYQPGWAVLKVIYPYMTAVNSPNASNITEVEIIVNGIDAYNSSPTQSFYFDQLDIDLYDQVPSTRIGQKNVGEEGFILFWWDDNSYFNLAENEERNFVFSFSTPQYIHLTTWHTQYPTDDYITEQYNAMIGAEFYWEQYLAERKASNYLQGNPGQNLFTITGSSGSNYNPLDTPIINILTSDKLGNLVSANVTANVTYPNGTSLSSGNATESTTGRYNYNFTIPSNSPEGDYAVVVHSEYFTYNSSDIHTISVSNASSSGGLPLNLFSGVGTTYSPGETVYVVSTTLNSNGNLVNATVDVTMKYSNGTILSTGSPQLTSTGRFIYNNTLPDTTPEGTYYVELDANYSGNEIHETITFQVKNTTSGSGTSYPIINLQVGNPIATSTQTSIGALVTSSTGVPANCVGDLSLTIKDLNSGTIELGSGNMTNYGTGLYNYTWTTPGSSSVYGINASCLVSGTEYSGFTMLSTQSVSASANVDYNQIATYVWEYSSRNLTYYNQSIAENIESCLQDGACTGWWINTTLTGINNTLSSINTSVANIEGDSNNLISYFNCTLQNEVCDKLTGITNNVTDIQSRVETLNTTQIPALQTGIDNIYSDTQWLYTNVATQSNISEVVIGINNLQTNISYIINNMFYQGNATGSFIVDYLSTPYANSDEGDDIELWTNTRDLLGNEKTVSAATCEIWKDNSYVANATSVNISAGGVYAYWDVPSTASGEYYWNCTLTGSTVNLQIPFYVEGGEFEITSVVTSTPKYPNEAALVEVTFADQSGNDVEPDSINISIYQPPTYATTWATGTKSNFAQIGNVWRYTNTIEANPTTGTYITHVNASYEGIIASETIQFRIATGGPYMVVLACPDTSAVGSNLNCNVIIQDEGESATESTCDVWVDTDGDNNIDATEPQVQFSKETLPLDNVTQPVSINVPSTHSAGDYVTRVSCSYANSVQPDSPASDLVTLTSTTPQEEPESPSGGGGGGTGDAITPTPETPPEPEEVPYAFVIDVNILPKYKQLLLGEDTVISEILIYNTGEIKLVNGVELEYYIQNKAGKIFELTREDININDKIEILRGLNVSEGLPLGTYDFVVKVKYGDIGATSKESFEVVEKEFLAPPKGDCCKLPEIGWINWIIIFLLLVLFWIILCKRRKRKDRENGIKQKRFLCLFKRRKHIVYVERKRRFVRKKKFKNKHHKPRMSMMERNVKLLARLRRQKKLTEGKRQQIKGKLIKHLSSKNNRANKKKEDLNRLLKYIKEEV